MKNKLLIALLERLDTLLGKSGDLFMEERPRLQDPTKPLVNNDPVVISRRKQLEKEISVVNCQISKIVNKPVVKNYVQDQIC